MNNSQEYAVFLIQSEVHIHTKYKDKICIITTLEQRENMLGRTKFQEVHLMGCFVPRNEAHGCMV